MAWRLARESMVMVMDGMEMGKEKRTRCNDYVGWLVRQVARTVSGVVSTEMTSPSVPCVPCLPFPHPTKHTCEGLQPGRAGRPGAEAASRLCR